MPLGSASGRDRRARPARMMAHLQARVDPNPRSQARIPNPDTKPRYQAQIPSLRHQEARPKNNNTHRQMGAVAGTIRYARKQSGPLGAASPRQYSAEVAERECVDVLVKISLRTAGCGRAEMAVRWRVHPGLRKSLRKEVIQPQVLLRLPCYDLVPVTDLAVGTPELERLRALPAPMT